MHLPLLQDIVVVLGLSIGVLLILYRLKVPLIVGFLITGVLAGPSGFGLVTAGEEVDLLAEIGIVLLLFTIGVELSLKNLLKMKRQLLVGGATQVCLTIAIAALVANLVEADFRRALFIGMLVSLSSTAIVLKVLQQRGELDAPQGRASVSILIFQDIAAVPMLLAVPLLLPASPSAGGIWWEWLLVKSLLLVIFIVVAAKWVIPKLLDAIAATRNNELFLISVIVICLGVAWVTSEAGLSLALGAFLAGLIISESPYSHQALGNIAPFRDVFTSFFFVAVGMLIDVDFVLSKPILIAGLAVGVLLLKTIVAGGASLLLGYPIRTAVLVGLSLSQVGEFAFIVSEAGRSAGLLSPENYQLFLAVSALTMALTPFLIALAPRVAEQTVRVPQLRKLNLHRKLDGHAKAELKGHLVIIGFGLNGTNLARAARAAEIPYAIIEMNPETVRKARLEGEPIHYGDAVRSEILHVVSAEQARVFVIAISDTRATRQIVESCRRMNPQATIIARTRYAAAIKSLYESGANEVVPEEFETSVEIFTRVMRHYLVPEDAIERVVADVRSDTYQIFRSQSDARTAWNCLVEGLTDLNLATLEVAAESEVAGSTIAEIDLRGKWGILLLLVRREGTITRNPTPDFTLRAGDVVVLFGDQEKIAEVTGLFSGKPAETT